MRADTITRQQIRKSGDAAYARSHPVPDDVRRAVWAIWACRTAVLGGHVQACPAGHLERIWYHSCRHRMCPPWAWGQGERWLARQKGRLFAGEHEHVSCTMPHELHDRWRANVAVMTPRRCARVHETLVARRGEPHDLGAQPGIIATRHPWSQTLRLHPHLPCLVIGGGVTERGQWGAVRNGFVLPMRVVMAVFRGTWLAAIRHGVVQGTRPRPAGQRQPLLDHRLNQLGRAKWHGPIRERDPDGHGVLVDLARSWRGGPLAHRRLRACAGPQVVLG